MRRRSTALCVLVLVALLGACSGQTPSRSDRETPVAATSGASTGGQSLEEHCALDLTDVMATSAVRQPGGSVLVTWTDPQNGPSAGTQYTVLRREADGAWSPVGTFVVRADGEATFTWSDDHAPSHDDVGYAVTVETGCGVSQITPESSATLEPGG
ncbi:hypothetical protein [Cellulomonas composti]|uniref:Fibronectin type-III domain-containing protein n=1 Tax=Cellulomonas composti TaxID=266130 RepID=A0A511J8W4_9CELL|nr:hypothetical protein [Cellulomonas composti]GEL94436.1 hypothetical protein CCO02nite_10940 [Cellulomonas composti]